MSRCAILINDLVRHPLHLALVYAGFPLMRSYVSRIDGLLPCARPMFRRICIRLSGRSPNARVEISRHFLFRMGVIAWKGGIC